MSKKKKQFQKPRKGFRVLSRDPSAFGVSKILAVKVVTASKKAKERCTSIWRVVEVRVRYLSAGMF